MNYIGQTVRLLHVVGGLHTALLLTLALCPSMTHAHQAQPAAVVENPVSASKAPFWTAERIRNARPFPLPTAGGASAFDSAEADVAPRTPTVTRSGEGSRPESWVVPNLSYVPVTARRGPQEISGSPDGDVLFTPDGVNARGTSGADFTSSRLVPVASDLSYPYSTIGKLFFRDPSRAAGQDMFECSAAVLRPRVVLTAGHCVHSGRSYPGFYTDFLFIPAYREGAEPYHAWDWAFAVVTGSWASGGGAVPNAADFAMLEMREESIGGQNRRIGSITGYLGYQTVSLIPNHAHLIGYPGNFDDGELMHQVTAASLRPRSPNCVEYGSDMRGGSSGGPWIMNFGDGGGGQSARNRIVGVTSYGPVPNDPLYQGSSVPGDEFLSILNIACAHRNGNCP